METKADEAITLTPYNPDNLLDTVIAKLNLKNDAALCRYLDVPAPLISKIRRRKLTVGASLLIRMHEATDLSVGELRRLIETPSEQQHCRRPKAQELAKAQVSAKASLLDSLASFSKLIEEVREPLRQLALIQCAQERYPDHEERSNLLKEYRCLLDASRSSLGGWRETGSDMSGGQAEQRRESPERKAVVSDGIADFAANHPLIKELFHCLHLSR
jgi:hypothetical protein